jgi:hypothetical protein
LRQNEFGAKLFHEGYPGILLFKWASGIKKGCYSVKFDKVEDSRSFVPYIKPSKRFFGVKHYIDRNWRRNIQVPVGTSQEVFRVIKRLPNVIFD